MNRVCESLQDRQSKHVLQVNSFFNYFEFNIPKWRRGDIVCLGWVRGQK